LLLLHYSFVTLHFAAGGAGATATSRLFPGRCVITGPKTIEATISGVMMKKTASV